MISPSSAVSSPATRLSSVDLPQPDGPMIATNSPGVIGEVDAAQRAHRRALGLERLAQPARRPRRSRLTRRSGLLRHVRLLDVDAVRRCTGAFRPLTGVLAERLALERGAAAPRAVASLSTIAPGRPRQVLEPLREVHGVADERVLEPLLRAEQRGRDLAGREADAEPERREPAATQRSLSARWRSSIATRRARPRGRRGPRAANGAPKHRHHRVADELHDRAALVEDGVVHLGAVLVELRRERARVGALGDARVAADVAT